MLMMLNGGVLPFIHEKLMEQDNMDQSQVNSVYREIVKLKKKYSIKDLLE